MRLHPRIPFRLAAGVLLAASLLARSAAAQAPVLGDPIDVAHDFRQTEQVYFVGARVTRFDPSSGAGLLQWDRWRRTPSYSFGKIDLPLARAASDEFPATEYDRDPALPFRIDFVSPRTVRLRFATRDVPIDTLADAASLMLAGPPPVDRSWRLVPDETAILYRSPHGELRLTRDPWRIEIRDAAGRLVTRTQTATDPASFTPTVPFAFVRRARDMGRSVAATFELAPDEKIFGAGESFTRLDKRGQRLVLWLRDAMGAQSRWQYKAVPFFLSSNGYGMFVHTSTPVTFDFGHDFDQHATLYAGDDLLDLFIFLGDPADVVSEYTALTGRSPMPPLWSFGLWMSRITYKSEEEVRDVAARLREHRIPADVLHLDTGWFETDWRNDYRFSRSRFADPRRMIADLKKMGFRVSLWQLPYVARKNALWETLLANGYAVRGPAGGVAGEDATLDFSNAAAVAWYQGELKRLLEMGVGAIKADFGESAPLDGVYASGRTGWAEHNLYPVRYNRAAWEVTNATTGEGIIWARSAWAGSQRYPLHWGGDAENTNSAMAATLRAGLSMGLSGFTFWSHDIGGFVGRPADDLYRRWAAFGALTSHARAHGTPPREPWEFGPEVERDFRRAFELRYRLMPYIYAQARASSERGWPMMRPLFFGYPHDPTSWLIEDEYLFGADLLVAPLFAETDPRKVYLPPGTWIDYQTGRRYAGEAWHDIKAGDVPIVVLARSGAAIPHVALAQSTAELDWSRIELRVFSADGGAAAGSFARPGEELATLEVRAGADGEYRLAADPLSGSVRWQITTAAPPPAGDP